MLTFIYIDVNRGIPGAAVPKRTANTFGDVKSNQIKSKTKLRVSTFMPTRLGRRVFHTIFCDMISFRR